MFFLSNPFDAMVVGVGAHWCQYLALNYKIYLSKESNQSYVLMILFFIILYSLIMTYFGFELYTLNDYSNLLVLIPLTGNMFHFYTDMYIWKFSDPHVRESIGKKIYT